MATNSLDLKDWAATRIHPEEITPYLDAQGRSFLDAGAIRSALTDTSAPDAAHLLAILYKSLDLQDLSLDEAATLTSLQDDSQRLQAQDAAQAVRRKAHGDRVNVFAPLFLGNACVNACSYCGFRDPHNVEVRRVLKESEVIAAVEVLAGDLGHCRVLAVAGEHPSSDAKYIADCISAIKSVQAGREGNEAHVCCVCLNAPPMCLEDLRKILAAGADAYHVYQETYDQAAYANVHPSGPKADFNWRLTAQHRALAAGFGQVGLGFLAGLADWRFELLAILQHAAALKARFGRGPATVTVQRIAAGHPAEGADQALDDDAFLNLVALLRLALPNTGIVVPSCEGEPVRRRALALGATETDTTTNIGVGAYHEGGLIPALSCRQFSPGQGSTLKELAKALEPAGLKVAEY